MDDVIKRVGHVFGANEFFMLFSLSLAAIPTSFVIFLEIVTTEEPEVCIWNPDRSHCMVYNGEPSDVCRLADQTLWRFNYPLETIISTYNLLCHDYWEQCLPQVLFYFGMLPSCLLAGYVSDQFGRKTSLILFLFMESLSLSLLIAVRGYIGFLILRYFTGLSIGYFLNCGTLIIEGLKVEYRHTFLASIWCSFSFGTMVLGLLSMLFHRYIDMVACVIVFNVLLLLIYVLGIDESLRWLLIKQKKDRAQYMLNKIAYHSKVEMPKYEDIPQPKDEQYSIRDFFTLRKSRMITLILLQLSILSFYLLVDFTQTSMDAIMSEHSFRKYGFKNSRQARAINFLLSGCVNLVGVVLTGLLCKVAGRRPTVVLELGAILVALVMLLSMGITMRKHIVSEVSSYIIRIVAPGLVYLSSLYSLEVHITPLRARAVGLATAGLALGGILSSAKNFSRAENFDKDEIIITSVEIGIVLYMMVLCMKLPETKGRMLPDCLEHMPETMRVTDWCKCKQVDETMPLLEGDSVGSSMDKCVE